MKSLTGRLLSLLLVLLITTIISVVAVVDRPNFKAFARVKQHFHKTGDLIAGEEHLLKVIVKWDAISAAEGYVLCHNCNHILEETGVENGDVDGTIYPIEIGGVRSEDSLIIDQYQLDCKSHDTTRTTRSDIIIIYDAFPLFHLRYY